MFRPHFALLSLLGVLGCSAGTEPRMDGPFVALTVNGTVRSAEGAPISGARLELRAGNPGTCSGTYADASATSDANGAFAGTMANWNVPRDVCVWIAVAPPDGSGLTMDTITVQPARLDFEAQVISVDILLPVTPGS